MFCVKLFEVRVDEGVHDVGRPTAGRDPARAAVRRRGTRRRPRRPTGRVGDDGAPRPRHARRAGSAAQGARRRSGAPPPRRGAAHGRQGKPAAGGEIGHRCVRSGNRRGRHDRRDRCGHHDDRAGSAPASAVDDHRGHQLHQRLSRTDGTRCRWRGGAPGVPQRRGAHPLGRAGRPRRRHRDRAPSGSTPPISACTASTRMPA